MVVGIGEDYLMIPQWNSIWYTKKYRRKWDLLYFPISSCFTVYHPLGPERIACSFCGILTIVAKHYHLDHEDINLIEN